MKKIHIILIVTFLFLCAGYIFHINKTTKWDARYNLYPSEKFTILANSVDRILIKTEIKEINSIKIIDEITNELKHLPQDIFDSYKDLQNINLGTRKLTLSSNNINNFDTQVPEYLALVNKRLRTFLKNNLNLYETISYMKKEEEIEFIKNNLDIIIQTNQKTEKDNDKDNDNSENKKLSNSAYTFNLVTRLIEVLEDDTNEPLIILEESAAADETILSTMTMEKIINLRNLYVNKTADDYLEYRRLQRLNKDLINEDFLKLSNRVKLINRTPTLVFTLISFGVAGLIFGFIWVYLNSKYGKQMIRKKLKFLQDLE